MAGLRLKFNLVLVPLMVAATLLMVWLDYRHEVAAVMELHSLHRIEPGAKGHAGPLDPATLPESVARRSLYIHAVYGISMLILLVFATNAALDVFVLRGINRIRARIARMERGHWREGIEPTSEDEFGQLVASFQELGLEIDALTAHLLHAERLAVLAVVSTKLSGQIEPVVNDLGLVAGELYHHPDTSVRRNASRITAAAATILSAARGLDHAFRKPPLATSQGVR